MHQEHLSDRAREPWLGTRPHPRPRRLAAATALGLALLAGHVPHAAGLPSGASGASAATTPTTPAAPATSAESPALAPTTASEAKARGWCSVTKCETWSVPYYAHGIAYVPAWKRCVRWETRAKVKYKVARAVTGSGFKSHMVQGLSINNHRMKLTVRRWCETSGNNPKRKVGGVLLLPSLNMTGRGAGSCTLGLSAGLSFPWSIGVSVAPSCSKAKVATRDAAFASSRKKSTYSFSDAEPHLTQLKYKRFEAMLDPDWYSNPDHVVCFATSFKGSVEHPLTGNSKGIGKSATGCINLLAGDPRR